MFKKLLSMLLRRLNKSHLVLVGDPGRATHSFIRVDSEGRRHEHLVGRTAYGKGSFPTGGHKVNTMIAVGRNDPDGFRAVNRELDRLASDEEQP